MILFWVIVGAVLIVFGLFIFTQGGQNLGPAISTIGVAILLILLVSPARGHDHGRPNLDSWYSGLRSGKGACCDGPKVDAKYLADADWESSNGNYRVFLDGEWIDVPANAVLPGPNLDGRTLVWPSWQDGQRTVRCFLPGSMT